MALDPTGKFSRFRFGLMPDFPSHRIALFPLVFLTAAVVIWPLRAADTLVLNSCSEAGTIGSHGSASQEQGGGWKLEDIEIQASLPELAKSGRLRAIRRISPAGQPEYQILELAGDRTVRQQVIARYLSTDAQSTARPASSTAITPANYKFHYLGSVNVGNARACTFQIIPRRKREGLIKGEVWLDSETGIAMRESGYLVKNPSLLVKRIRITRESSLRDGTVEARITHLSVETRLVGRVELVIEERPFLGTADSTWTRIEGR